VSESPSKRRKKRADAAKKARGLDPSWRTVEPKPTIDELTTLLENDESIEIEIMPNGEIRQRGRTPQLGNMKPLTMREDLGGEYAQQPASSDRQETV
jgi:hypothetical protein